MQRLGEITVARRFRGPPESGNGGYTCGRLAGFVDAETVEVTLRSPPPLDTPLAVSRAEGLVTLDWIGAGGEPSRIAEARAAEPAGDVPPPVRFDDALDAVARFPAREHHPYPSCFVCGTDRAPGDGLCLHPGPVHDRALVAAPFVVPEDLVDERAELDPAFVWASLDCPSWYGYLAFADDRPPILLGRLTATVRARPRAGDRCVALGWSVGRDGRKVQTGSALYREDGTVLGHARATWIVLRSAVA